MAGRTRHQARNAFLEPIQRALTCITPAQLVFVPRAPGDVEALTTSDAPFPLRTRQRDHLWLHLEQQYVMTEWDDARGPWKASTKAYRYRIDDAGGRELVSWHWHPQSRIDDPHLHVGEGPLVDAHLPTGRVSVERVLRLLLTDLDVVARRADWTEVLDEVEQAFTDWRTWA